MNLFNNTETIYFDVINPDFGIWSAVYSTVSPSACIFMPAETSNSYADPGFIPINQLLNQQFAPLMDNPSPYIIQGSPNLFVLHMNGMPCPAVVTSLQIYQNYQLLYSSMSQIRYHCAYEYYFGWITCNQVGSYYYKVQFTLHLRGFYRMFFYLGYFISIYYIF